MSDGVKAHIILRGTLGLLDQERFAIDLGSTVLIGRSAHADISLKRCEKFLLMDPGERELSSSYQSVSRKHLRLTFERPDHIELEDLSSNGSYLDGTRFQRTRIRDLQERSHEIQIGSGECFLLEWGRGKSTGLSDSNPSSEDLFDNENPFDEGEETRHVPLV